MIWLLFYFVVNRIIFLYIVIIAKKNVKCAVALPRHAYTALATATCCTVHTRNRTQNQWNCVKTSYLSCITLLQIKSHHHQHQHLHHSRSYANNSSCGIHKTIGAVSVAFLFYHFTKQRVVYTILLCTEEGKL